MNTIEEVKKIEQQAKDLKASYNQKLMDMEKTAQDKISEMKITIDRDITVVDNKLEQERAEKFMVLRKQLDEETEQEIDQLHRLYESKQTKLVDIVIEEVRKQYGNS